MAGTAIMIAIVIALNLINDNIIDIDQEAMVAS